MHLYDLPMICVLIGLALYAVLGGADFGAGFWQLTSILLPGRTEQERQRAQQIREHAHHSMGPVWEANHVWLIFVLTVTWTGYPIAFGAIASTLAVPLFIAGLGIVFRGAAYALRAGTSKPRELGLIDTIFSLSCDPHALRAGSYGRRDRIGESACRQRERTPPLQLAEPDLTHDRRARGPLLRLHGGGLPRRGRRSPRRARDDAAVPDPRADRRRACRRSRNRSSACAELAGTPGLRTSHRRPWPGWARDLGAGGHCDAGVGERTTLRAGPHLRGTGRRGRDRRLGARAAADPAFSPDHPAGGRADRNADRAARRRSRWAR